MIRKLLKYNEYRNYKLLYLQFFLCIFIKNYLMIIIYFFFDNLIIKKLIYYIKLLNIIMK